MARQTKTKEYAILHIVTSVLLTGEYESVDDFDDFDNEYDGNNLSVLSFKTKEAAEFYIQANSYQALSIKNEINVKKALKNSKYDYFYNSISSSKNLCHHTVQCLSEFISNDKNNIILNYNNNGEIIASSSEAFDFIYKLISNGDIQLIKCLCLGSSQIRKLYPDQDEDDFDSSPNKEGFGCCNAIPVEQFEIVEYDTSKYKQKLVKITTRQEASKLAEIILALNAECTKITSSNQKAIASLVKSMKKFLN